MSDLFSLFAVFALLAAILANIALWSPRRLRVKVVALITTGLLLPLAYVSLSEMLSRPKPIEVEWARNNLTEATVIGSRMEEGKAIYLWLELEGAEGPRAYALPWSEELARELHGAKRNAEANGTKVRMRKPFENSRDRREQMFYAQPQPPNPEKEAIAENPLSFQRSEAPQSKNN